MIIEPITSINNEMATPYFYKRLHELAREEGITFVVDETKTGLGRTGKLWGHDHWNLKDKPDIVTFGSILSGFFTTYDVA